MSTSNSSSPCCPPGSWEGPLNTEEGPSTPKGTTFALPDSELKVYYSEPSKKDSKLGLVVFHDIWGHLPRFLSICDTFAEQGYHVIAPDCFRGKTIADVEGDGKVEWLKSHPYDEMIAGDIQECLDYLKTKKGVESFGSLGFCWGGWAIAKSAGAGIPWKVGVCPHPSLKMEAVFGRDEAEMVSKVHMPFLLLPAGNDPDNVKPGGDHVKKLEEKGGKSVLFDDMIHGFVTRSDLTVANTKAQVEKALSLALEFIQEHLK
jgi:dienelactone hydrolase